MDWPGWRCSLPWCASGTATTSTTSRRSRQSRRSTRITSSAFSRQSKRLRPWSSMCALCFSMTSRRTASCSHTRSYAIRTSLPSLTPLPTSRRSLTPIKSHSSATRSRLTSVSAPHLHLYPRLCPHLRPQPLSPTPTLTIAVVGGRQPRSRGRALQGDHRRRRCATHSSLDGG